MVEVVHGIDLDCLDLVEAEGIVAPAAVEDLVDSVLVVEDEIGIVSLTGVELELGLDRTGEPE